MLSIVKIIIWDFSYQKSPYLQEKSHAGNPSIFWGSGVVLELLPLVTLYIVSVFLLGFTPI